MENTFEKIILRFMERAGKLSIEGQGKLGKNYCKEETAASVVTETDLKISALFKETLEKEIEGDDYIIIDEETIDSLGEDKFKTASSKTYQFIIDPIDGTLPYSMDIPFYGTTVGVFKNMKPLMGATYCPSLGELVTFNGERVLHIKNPFTTNEKSTEVTGEGCNPVFIFPKPSSVQIETFNLNRKEEVVIDLYATVVHCIYMALGRAKAMVYSVWVWDLAGSWAFLNKLGFGVYNIETEEELTELSEEGFTSGFKTKDFYIICKKKDFPRMKELSRSRKR